MSITKEQSQKLVELLSDSERAHADWHVAFSHGWKDKYTFRAKYNEKWDALFEFIESLEEGV